MPEDWTITPGVGSEPHVLAQKLQKGAFYVMDRLYAQRHWFLQEMQEAGADFVVRLNNNVILTPEEPERPLRAQDRKAGVVWDRRMRLGVHGTGPLLRVVRVEAQGKIFQWATSRQDLEAELIGLIYRQCWQIEVFFQMDQNAAQRRPLVCRVADGRGNTNLLRADLRAPADALDGRPPQQADD